MQVFKSTQAFMHVHISTVNFSSAHFKKCWFTINYISVYSPATSKIWHTQRERGGKKWGLEGKLQAHFETFWFAFLHSVSSIPSPSNQNMSNLTRLNAPLWCGEPVFVFFLLENSNKKKNLMTSSPASHQAFVALKITPGCGEFTVGNAHSHPTLRPPSQAPGKEPGNKIQYSCWCWRQIRAGGNAGDTSSLQNL